MPGSIGRPEAENTVLCRVRINSHVPARHRVEFPRYRFKCNYVVIRKRGLK